MRSVQRPAGTLCLLVLLLFTLSGCGSKEPALSISATQTSVLLGENVQFTATGPSVSSWSVNGVDGGSAVTGTISTSGFYTAPQVLPSPASVTVTAKSSLSSSTASLRITSDISVAFSSSNLPTAIPALSTLSLSVAITSKGAPNTNVTWTVNGVANGNAQLGTITTQGNGAVIYTAPATPPSGPVQIAATSVADPSKSATLTLGIEPVQALNVSILELPAGVPANITVTGPNGYTQQVTSQKQILVLPGSYTVIANSVVGSASRYFPGVTSQTVQVASAVPSTVTVDYSTIIPNSTQVLDATGMSTLTVSADQSTISFASSSTITSSLAIGNILASTATSAAPNGLLVKILSFGVSNGTVTATVEPASLSEAIQQGSLVFSQAFGSSVSPASAQVRESTRSLLGKSLSQSAPSGYCAGNTNTIQEPFTLPLATGVSVTGEDDLCMSFSGNLQIAGFSITSLTAQVSLGLQSSLGLELTTQGSFDYPHSFPTLKAGPYPFLIGDVPVEIQPTLTPFVELKGSGAASAYTGFTSNSTITIGTSYANGNWGPVDTAVATEAGTASSDDANLSAQASVGLKASLIFDGTVTTSISGDAYLQLSAGLNANPCWTVTGGLEASADISARFFGFTAGYSTPNLPLYTKPLFSADSGCFAPTLQSVSPASSYLNAAATPIVLTGTNFVPDSVVKFSGQPLPTTFVSPTQLNAIIPASELMQEGSFPITVFSPDNPGGTSQPVQFAVTGIIVKVSPPSAVVPLGKTQPFAAKVTGTANTAVIWTVNDIPGGNPSIGTISANGLYTAPVTLPSPSSVLVTAVSQVQPTAKGVSSVSLCTPGPTGACELLYGRTGNGSLVSMDPVSGIQNTIYVFPSNFSPYAWEATLDRNGQRFFQLGQVIAGSTSTNVLYTVDLSKTNTASTQNVPNLDDLTYDPSNGLLYGIEQTSGPVLVSLDPASGAVTPVYNFPSGFNPLYGFTLDATGHRFFQVGTPTSASTAKQLYVIDISTTNTANVLSNVPNLSNIRFDSPTGLLYGIDDESSGSSLVTIDAQTGSVTPIYHFPSGTNTSLWGEALDSTGRRFFQFVQLMPSYNTSFYTIDLTGRTVPTVNSSSPPLSGLQY